MGISAATPTAIAWYANPWAPLHGEGLHTWLTAEATVAWDNGATETARLRISSIGARLDRPHGASDVSLAVLAAVAAALGEDAAHSIECAAIDAGDILASGRVAETGNPCLCGTLMPDIRHPRAGECDDCDARWRQVLDMDRRTLATGAVITMEDGRAERAASLAGPILARLRNELDSFRDWYQIPDGEYASPAEIAEAERIAAAAGWLVVRASNTNIAEWIGSPDPVLALEIAPPPGWDDDLVEHAAAIAAEAGVEVGNLEQIRFPVLAIRPAP